MNIRKTPNIFKGSTNVMHGNVFQGYGEFPNKYQFTKTLEALSTYISTYMDFPKDGVSICRKIVKEVMKGLSDLTEEELKIPVKKLI